MPSEQFAFVVECGAYPCERPLPDPEPCACEDGPCDGPPCEGGPAEDPPPPLDDLFQSLADELQRNAFPEPPDGVADPEVYDDLPGDPGLLAADVAAAWNALEAGGEEVDDDEAAWVNERLTGTGWVVGWDPVDNEWVAAEVEEFAERVQPAREFAEGPRLFEEGFTGKKEDSAGRTQCYDGGRHVPCDPGAQPADTDRPAAGPPDGAALGRAPRAALSGNSVFKVSLDGKDFVVKQKSWDSNNTIKKNAEAEQLVSDLGRIAGVNMPASWSMKVGLNEAAVSEFVPGKVMKDMSQDERRAALAKVSPASVTRQTLFDYAVGYRDSHDGNYMISDKGDLVGIDKEFSLTNDGSVGAAWRVPAYARELGGGGYKDVPLDRQEAVSMVQKAGKMAEALRAAGKGKDADYVAQRAAVLGKLAALPSPTMGDLDRLATEAHANAPGLDFVRRTMRKLGF